MKERVLIQQQHSFTLWTVCANAALIKYLYFWKRGKERADKAQFLLWQLPAWQHLVKNRVSATHGKESGVEFLHLGYTAAYASVASLSIKSSTVFTRSFVSSFSLIRCWPVLRRITSTSLLKTRSATCIEICQGTSSSFMPWMSRMGHVIGIGLLSTQWFSASLMKSYLKE